MYNRAQASCEILDKNISVAQAGLGSTYATLCGKLGIEKRSKDVTISIKDDTDPLVKMASSNSSYGAISGGL